MDAIQLHGDSSFTRNIINGGAGGDIIAVCGQMLYLQ